VGNSKKTVEAAQAALAVKWKFDLWSH
jgi:hypothetical protein